MVIASPRTAARALIGIPDDFADERDHRKILARGIRQLQERSVLRGAGSPSPVTGNYTMTDNDYLILGNATSGNLTVTLLTAASRATKEVAVKKTDASGNVVTIAGGTSSVGLLSQGAVRVYVSDGASWQLVSALGNADGLGNVL